ncbi:MULTISPECIES: LLM class flavin-dependent oxidoreductase [Thermomonospora]|uniref:Luciferase-like monooxygenase n=1 Tax=Thermomonospora curvata (strain ATCC 19995 / DSM 43183 / JCM 3096 / KCTC 9072 / NBRC 15933 / NCIMB 10081 / Henssen B9) TaxID=471852 RepID=D1A5W0_THECD|nr:MULTISPECIES: LLM class flavin-dependent oxidoreductase [Thermomonospora]ACY98255.1 Luciferase-like monooxygenase [Thermomonospora curvata DSM 43183]PKK13424.1 MAG: LLM class flavin-dependent oxidoreductase [Thermomonospora sp. CIF 1]
MKFGIMNLFPVAEGTSDHEVLRETLEEIELADQLGFDSVWLAEHHFSKYGILGNPLNLAMAIAERTKRITIGTAVVVLPLHHPLRLAEDIAALDVLSGGRVAIGVGRGYQPAEFRGFGVPLEESKRRYQESLEVLRLALSQENFSYHGEFFQLDDVTTYPRPLTAGGPPILQGTVSPDSFRERGARGEAIITSPNFTPLGIMQKNFNLYRTAMEENGHDITQYDLPFMQQVWCGEGEEGLHEAAQAALNYYRTVGKVIPGSKEALEQERSYYEAVAKNIKLLTLEKTLTHGGNFGSPQKVIETIEMLREQLGITHYICWLRIPSLDRKTALKSMEEFATKVIPHFRAQEDEQAASSTEAVAG